MTRQPADPALSRAIEWERRRLSHSTDPVERRIIWESLRRWQEMARQARQEPPKAP